MEDSSVNGSVNGSGPSELQSNGTCSFLSNGTTSNKSPAVIFKFTEVEKELVRLIGQHLKKMGLERTADTLVEEAGLKLDHASAESFCKHVLRGEWPQAETDIQDLKPLIGDDAAVSEIRFLLYEQSYLEHLESGNAMEALKCLRSSLTPLAQKVERVHQLSSLMFISDPEELRKAANWPGAGTASRTALMDKLTSYLPPRIMLPHNKFRLEKLLVQALEYQRSLCMFHNSANDSHSFSGITTLLEDHQCYRQELPLKTYQILSDHTDEVWIAKFSPNGLLLATGCKDSTAIIWKVHPESYTVTRRCVLDGHNYGIVFLAWSPDSTKLIVCLHEEASELLIYDTTGAQVCKVSNSSEDSLTSAAWYNDSRRFVCGGIRGQFYLCELDGRVSETWEGVRVQCLASIPNSTMILASDTHHRIRGYQLEQTIDVSMIQEEQSVMSFTLDQSGRYALLNVATQGVHLWDLESKTLVRRFRGPIQGHYTIHSSFGGKDDCYMASGSEDNKVYVWHRSEETAIAKLPGHTKTVNCVTWNPVFIDMMASVSDDNTVRIWGPGDSSGDGKIRGSAK